jgi:hypothetical protein
MVRDPNRDALLHIAAELGTLRDEFVFVGGSIVGLYITDPAAPSVRPTDDVDVIVGVTTRCEYDHRIREALLSRGFSELVGADIPVCAWQKEGSWTAGQRSLRRFAKPMNRSAGSSHQPSARLFAKIGFINQYPAT